MRDIPEQADLVLDIERRQQEVLAELDLLNERIERAIKEFSTGPSRPAVEMPGLANGPQQAQAEENANKAA